MITSGGLATAGALNGAFREMLSTMLELDTIDTEASTASTTYTALSPAGPSVVVTSRGTRALAMITARAWNTTAANQCCMGVQVTDIENTVVHAASDSAALIQQGGTTRATSERLWICLPINLGEPGTYTYTALYRAAAGTATFGNRDLAVFAP